MIYNRFPCYGAMICFEGRKNYREKKETKVKSASGITTPLTPYKYYAITEKSYIDVIDCDHFIFFTQMSRLSSHQTGISTQHQEPDHHVLTTYTLLFPYL